MAVREGVSESEVWRIAAEAGLPLVPKKLARKRKAAERAASREKTSGDPKGAGDNVVSFARAKKPTTGFEPVTYGLRNRWPNETLPNPKALRQLTAPDRRAVVATSQLALAV